MDEISQAIWKKTSTTPKTVYFFRTREMPASPNTVYAFTKNNIGGMNLSFEPLLGQGKNQTNNSSLPTNQWITQKQCWAE